MNGVIKYNGKLYAPLPEEAIKEFKDRCTYFYMKTDGSYVFPNSREGDLIRMMHKAFTSPPSEGVKPQPNWKEIAGALITELRNCDGDMRCTDIADWWCQHHGNKVEKLNARYEQAVKEDGE